MRTIPPSRILLVYPIFSNCDNYKINEKNIKGVKIAQYTFLKAASTLKIDGSPA